MARPHNSNAQWPLIIGVQVGETSDSHLEISYMNISLLLVPTTSLEQPLFTSNDFTCELKASLGEYVGCTPNVSNLIELKELANIYNFR